MSSGALHGVVAQVASRDGVLFTGEAGVRTLGKPGGMTADTVMWIASMTKAVTTAAALQCVERGQLRLDSPASEWLPELQSIPVLDGFDSQDRPLLRSARTPITLRQLLTHTAGFAYEFFNADIARYMAQHSIGTVTSGSRATLQRPLTADPGSRWEYGVGVDWAGRLVEVVSGLRLGAYFQHHLFEPLGMHSSAVRITPAMRSRLAGMHVRLGDGSLAHKSIEVPQDAEFDMGGHALYSTPADYLRFLQMILRGGELDGRRVLAAGSVAEMMTRQIGEVSVPATLKTVNARISNDVTFFPKLPRTWGLGFMMNEAAVPSGRAAGSLAWAGLSNGYYWIDPVRGICATVMTQILPFFDLEVVRLLGAFEAEVYRALH